LFLSLLAAGVGSGDDVICPSLTWCSTPNAALYLGARPVFCDVDPDTLCVTADHVLAHVTRRTRAVLVVHFGGLGVDVDALRAALPGHVTVIEDAAHALGARMPNGRPVGSSGNATCFSFYANKNLSTGDGGAVAVGDGAVAQRLRTLRQHALPVDAWKRFTHPQALLRSNQLTELGYKMNYTDLQAAIGRVQLARQAEFSAVRREIACRYVEGLSGIRPALQYQRDCLEASHARHLFVVRLPLAETRRTRDEILLELRGRNIGVSIHYAPLHVMPLYRGDEPPTPLPITEEVARSIMTLPISASMTPDEADVVAEHVRTVMTASDL
jgi:perosamine synthetase